jgi:hypothetical protein
MSFSLVARIWEYKFTPSERAILQAMVDHADEAGGSIRPSVARIAWKTDYSDRQVQRCMHALTARGVLIVVRPASGRRPTEYRLNLDAAERKPAFVAMGDTMSPRHYVTPDTVSPIAVTSGDTVSPHETARGDIDDSVGVTSATSRGDTVSPEPTREQTNRNREKREIQPPSPLRVPDYSPAFLAFYEAYPKHENKKAAFELWQKLAPDQALIATIMAAIERQKRGRKWIDGYANAPDVWLRGAKWEDEPEPVRGPPTNGARPASAATTVKGWAERNGHGAVRDNDAGVAGVLPATIRR